MNREYDNIHDLLPDLFRCGALVFLIQPFYDANKRTTGTWKETPEDAEKKRERGKK